MKKSCVITQRSNVDISDHDVLANAIVIQAAKDYRSSYRIFNNPRCNREKRFKAMCILEDLESFFLGDWIKVLTRADGAMILQRLKESLEDERKFNCRNK